MTAREPLADRTELWTGKELGELEYLDGHHDLNPEKITVDGEEHIKVLGPGRTSQVGCGSLSHRTVVGTPDQNLRYALVS